MQISKVLFFVLCFFLVACGGSGKGDDESKVDVQTVEAMYNDAIESLDKKKYDYAVEKFEELERTYPYSKWAIKAQVMSAYASYKNERYDDALIMLERFTKLHPGNKDIAYAYYLRALSFYEQISDVTKDQIYSSYSKTALEEVVARFPGSRYAKDAQYKLDLVRDRLAGKEVDVGRFYLRDGKYIAAINRFQRVLDEYDTTAHVPESLFRLVEANISLGLLEEAVRFASVLGYNFPDSKWYKQAYKLVEAQKPAARLRKTKKWYDFSSWQGLVFTRNADIENRRHNYLLVEDVDRKVDDIGQSEQENRWWQIGSKSKKENVGREPLTMKKKGIFDRLKGWFKGVSMPFSGE